MQKIYKTHARLPSIHAISPSLLKKLASIVNDVAQEMYIPTPKGWKCKRKGCRADYKHSHGTFNCLKK